MLAIILLLGMVFYRQVEGWSWLDSLYFSVITLSTVGYGDMSPTTPESRIFTMAYIFLGLNIFVSIVTMLAKERQVINEKRREKHAEEKGDNERPVK